MPHSLPRSASEMAALCVDGFLRVEDLRDDGRDATLAAPLSLVVVVVVVGVFSLYRYSEHGPTPVN